MSRLAHGSKIKWSSSMVLLPFKLHCIILLTPNLLRTLTLTIIDAMRRLTAARLLCRTVADTIRKPLNSTHLVLPGSWGEGFFTKWREFGPPQQLHRVEYTSCTGTGNGAVNLTSVVAGPTP
jgi:hypothetical protein